MQTNFNCIDCHGFDNTNIDVIPTGKPEFIFQLPWPSKTGDVVHMDYNKHTNKQAKNKDKTKQKTTSAVFHATVLQASILLSLLRHKYLCAKPSKACDTKI